MNYITEEEVKVLKELSTRKGVKGQRLIKDLIWLNTVETKYKVYDTVKFISDNNVVLVGEIAEVRYEFISREITYFIEAKTAELINDEYEQFDRVYTVKEDNILDYSSKNENVVFVNTK